MKIGIANDHSAVDMKKQVVEYLVEKGYEVVNYGTDSYESCPYPKYGEKIGKAVADGEVDLGVAICGTGLGISMAANKVHGVRAAVCSEPYTAKMAREHNNANVIAFGARVIGIEMEKQQEQIKAMKKAFICSCCVYGELSTDWRLHKVLHLVKGRGYRST